MPYCVIQIRTQTNTFRNPEFQNYHKSFVLPPPTTVVGLAGAALGLSPKAAQDYFDGKGFEMGIAGSNRGKANDLWKYRTLDAKKPTSVLTREILYDGSFGIAFGHQDFKVIDELALAFESPFYAPVLGSSDSIAKIVKVDIRQDAEYETKVENCLWNGNAIADFFDSAQSGTDSLDMFISYKESMVYDLPVRFSYTSDYGVRRVSERRVFTFIGTAMSFSSAVKGIWCGDQFIPLFNY